MNFLTGYADWFFSWGWLAVSIWGFWAGANLGLIPTYMVLTPIVILALVGHGGAL